jgi:hypothetical protein
VEVKVCPRIRLHLDYHVQANRKEPFLGLDRKTESRERERVRSVGRGGEQGRARREGRIKRKSQEQDFLLILPCLDQ